MIKKAMIMAAGVGSRLGVLSEILPKPLVPLANVSVMDILLNNLSNYGIKDVIANTYYKAEYIQKHCKNNKHGINFNYIEEKELSGTAGGLYKCKFFLENEDDFIVMSGDGLSDVDIFAAYESHKRSNAVATIVTKEVQNSEVSKYGIIVSDDSNFIKSFQEKPKQCEAKSNLANTGIYLFKRDIFDFIKPDCFYDFAKDVFSQMMRENVKINTYNHKGYWSDVGSIEQYKQSNKDILEGKLAYFDGKPKKSEKGLYVIGENSIVDKSATIFGVNVIGKNCKFGKNTIIKNSILWDNVEIEDNITVENSIILSNSVVNTDIKDTVLKK